MKLSFEENNILETISALCAKDSKLIKDVFKALLLSSVLNLYDAEEDTFEILIPYIAKLIIKLENTNLEIKTKLLIEVIPQQSLKEEITCYINGDITSVKKLLKKNIVEGIMKKVDIDNVEIDV
jgi:hypothetical protein